MYVIAEVVTRPEMDDALRNWGMLRNCASQGNEDEGGDDVVALNSCSGILEKGS